VLLYTLLTIINFNLTHFSFLAGEAIPTPKTNDNSKQEITTQTQIFKFILSQEDLLHNNKCSPMFMQGPMLTQGRSTIFMVQTKAHMLWEGLIHYAAQGNSTIFKGQTKAQLFWEGLISCTICQISVEVPTYVQGKSTIYKWVLTKGSSSTHNS